MGRNTVNLTKQSNTYLLRKDADNVRHVDACCKTHVTLGGYRGKQEVMALCIEGWDFMQTLGEGAYGE